MKIIFSISKDSIPELFQCPPFTYYFRCVIWEINIAEAFWSRIKKESENSLQPLILWLCGSCTQLKNQVELCLMTHVACT